MRAVIIDDEPMARETIQSIMNSNFPQIQIAGQAGSVKEALPLLREIQPDLVFLDVDLSDGTGFDILTLIQPVKFKVIFITAHQEYAIKAIKFSALDYILKPVSSFELGAAVNKLLDESPGENNELKLQTLLTNYKASHKDLQKIVLRTSESIHIVDVEDIVHCESDNNYTTFYLKDSQKILVSKGLKEYDEMLTDQGFYRAHQSHLVNLRYISRFDKRDGGFLVLTDKSQIPVSQRKRQGLLDIFDKM